MFQYFHKQVRLDKFQSLPFGFAKSGELELRLAVLLLSKHKPRKLGIKNHSIETNMLDWTCSLKHYQILEIGNCEPQTKGLFGNRRKLGKAGLEWTQGSALANKIYYTYVSNCAFIPAKLHHPRIQSQTNGFIGLKLM